MAPQHQDKAFSPQPVQKWFVAFTSYRGQNPLYRKFLPYGFGHVFAFTPLGGGVLLVNPHEGGVALSVTPHLGRTASGLGVTASTFIEGLLYGIDDICIVEINAKTAANKKHLAMLMPSCVTVIKSILCRQSWALTPWQLFKGLCRQGGKMINEQSLAALKEQDVCKRQAALRQSK